MQVVSGAGSQTGSESDSVHAKLSRSRRERSSPAKANEVLRQIPSPVSAFPQVVRTRSVNNLKRSALFRLPAKPERVNSAGAVIAPYLNRALFAPANQKKNTHFAGRSSMQMKRLFFVAMTFICFSSHAHAEDYPDRPLRMIVPSTPGGAADIMARIIAERLRTSLHQAVVVENRVGANGNLAAEYVLSAPADGYTLLMGTIGLLAINPHVYEDVKFNPLTDFAPVTRTTTYPNVLVVALAQFRLHKTRCRRTPCQRAKPKCCVL
jgi:hypothetical protein